MSVETNSKARRLTIFLMGEDVSDFGEALDSEKSGVEVQLAVSSGIDGRFYYLPSKIREPDWMSYVAPIVGEGLDQLRSSSTYGLLLIRASGRIFALTFGHGRTLLDLSKIEHQFGLRVVLNRVDPQQMRSIDTKIFEDMVVTTSTQVSQNAELPAFRVNPTTDIVRSATGAPKDDGVTRQMSGSDSLVINVKTDVQELSSLCEDLLRAFNDDSYKEHFGWIDQLALVRHQSTIDQLDALLVADLATGNAASTHLAVPEVISWEDIAGFKVAGGTGREFEDLDLEAYLEDLGAGKADLKTSVLKSRRVSVRFGRNDEFDSRWSLYKCIVSEQRVGDVLHVLIEGRWFAVERSLVDEVDAYASGLPAPNTRLLDGRAGELEAEYNERLAASAPMRMLVFDAKIKRPGGAASGIEFCDVLTDEGEFIHVKRKSRSATLSHLFAQGSVSATTFFRDAAFREAVRAHVRETVPFEEQPQWLSLLPAGREDVHRQRYSVTYVVVANSKKSGVDWLPFFSKLNLMQHGRQLDALGVTVALARVPALEA